MKQKNKNGLYISIYRDVKKRYHSRVLICKNQKEARFNSFVYQNKWLALHRMKVVKFNQFIKFSKLIKINKYKDIFHLYKIPLKYKFKLFIKKILLDLFLRF